MNEYDDYEYIKGKDGQYYKLPNFGESKAIIYNNFKMIYVYMYNGVYVADTRSSFNTFFKISEKEWLEDNKTTIQNIYKMAVDKMKKLSNENEINKFMQECINSGEFNADQMYEIDFGFHIGLTVEQVKLYANPKFTAIQMQLIKYGLYNKMSMQQIQKYINNFNTKQLYIINDGFAHDLTPEEVELYANSELDWQVMQFIEEDLINGLTVEDIKVKYSKTKFNSNVIL